METNEKEIGNTQFSSEIRTEQMILSRQTPQRSVITTENGRKIKDLLDK